MNVKTTAGGDFLYQDVFMGDLDNVDTALLDISTLTASEVDSYGWVKPGTPLRLDGSNNLALITGTGQTVYTVVPSSVELRRSDNVGLSTDTKDIHIQAPVVGAVQRKAIEFNLGRVLNANEIAAFAQPGCKIQLIP